MARLIRDISLCLKAGRAFDISRGKVVRQSAFGRIWHLGDSQEKSERIQRVAKALSAALNRTPRLSLEEMERHENVKTARSFLKSLPKSDHALPKVRALVRAVTAARLGIETKTLASNPGFAAFALQSHLERYLLHYGQRLKVDSKTGEIRILCEGKKTAWPIVREKLAQLTPPPKNQPDNPRCLWLYGHDGVQKKDMYAWKELTPYKIEKNPSWGARYIFEFSACCGSGVQLQGDHSWLRLKTPKGEIYSVGLYRPGKLRWLDNFHLPMRMKQGYLMSPDVSEFWPMPIYRIETEISEQQFHAVKQAVEQDKRNEERLVFQIFKGNCTEYVNGKAALAGISLPTATHYLKNVTPPHWQKKAKRVIRHTPGWTQKIGTFVLTFLTNLLQISLGASMVDRNVQRKKLKAKPHISSTYDLFNGDKLKFHPPRTLALDIRPKVYKWRKKERERLTGKIIQSSDETEKTEITKQLIALDFSLPQQYRLPSAKPSAL